jgi:2-keto-4-pentenoate hydratase/2-oxohepta-3-ene-1,7-dioic acid hydratase in catechol pathway
MKIVTFKKSNGGCGYRIGSIMPDSQIKDLTHLVSQRDLGDSEILSCFDLEQTFYDRAMNATGDVINRNEVTVCAPVPRPGKIICIGLNYRDHAAESGMPIPTSP